MLHWSLLGRQGPTHKHKILIRSNTDQGFKHGDWKKRLLWKMKIANPRRNKAKKIIKFNVNFI